MKLLLKKWSDSSTTYYGIPLYRVGDQHMSFVLCAGGLNELKITRSGYWLVFYHEGNPDEELDVDISKKILRSSIRKAFTLGL